MTAFPFFILGDVLIPKTEENKTYSSGGSEAVRFGLDEASTAHLMRILRSTLYSNKLLAIVREYMTNAWDANIANGKSHEPIVVTLPTTLKPSLEISDSGPGLSEEDMGRVFTKYGASTKRESNEVAGHFGIGCKSAFCYSDSFVITSKHGGRKSIYTASLDESDIGELVALSHIPCNPEDTGLSVSIPILREDFRAIAALVYGVSEFMTPRPTVIATSDVAAPVQACDLTLFWDTVYKYDWYYSESSRYGFKTNGPLVRMGCVVYPLNTSELSNALKDVVRQEDLKLFLAEVQSQNLLIDVPIGKVPIAASREMLSYTKESREYIAELLWNSFCKRLDDDIKNSETKFKPWDRMLMYLNIPGYMRRYLDNQPVSPARRFDFYKSSPLHTNQPFKHFTIRNGYRSNSQITDSISVSSNAKIVFLDNNPKEHPVTKTLSYYPGTYVYVRPFDRRTLSQAWKELQQLISDIGIDGVPIINAKDLERNKKAEKKKTGRGNSNVYTYKRVLLNTNRLNGYPLSTRWLATSAPITDTELYVVLGKGFSADYRMFEQYYALCKFFSVAEEPIYGVREGTNPVGISLKVRLSSMLGEYVKSAEFINYADHVTMKFAVQNLFYANLDVLKWVSYLGSKHPLYQIGEVCKLTPTISVPLNYAPDDSNAEMYPAAVESAKGILGSAYKTQYLKAKELCRGLIKKYPLLMLLMAGNHALNNRAGDCRTTVINYIKDVDNGLFAYQTPEVFLKEAV